MTMSNQEKKQAAYSLATAFAAAIEDTLVSMTETEWPFEISEAAEQASQKGAAASYRLKAEGTLRGQLVVEFTESQQLSIISALMKQPVQEASEEQITVLAKLIAPIAEKLAGALAAEWGEVHFRVEESAEHNPASAFTVPLAVAAMESGAQVLLHFDTELIESLASKNSAQQKSKESDWAVHPRNLRLVMDVELDVTLRFGQRKLQLREVLNLNSGSIVELDRMVDEPVELLLGDKLIARGEAVVVDGNYGLRVTEIPQPVSQFLN